MSDRSPMRSRVFHLTLNPVNLLVLVTGVVLIVGAGSSAGAQPQHTVLYNFAGQPDGATPFAGLTIDSGGNLYGTAGHGGDAGYGEVFMLKRSGSTFTFNPLYSFTGGSDGAGPYARVVFGPGGALYGSTVAGGKQGCDYGGWSGCGVVFSLRPPATSCKTALCPWTETLLYSFVGAPDGAAPQGDLTFDAAGAIYGSTLFGGNGLGTIYELTRSGGPWTEQVLYRAPGGSTGGYPYDGVIFDTSGNLYGVFAAYGPYERGAVYQLTPSGSGWTENTVYGFLNEPADGYVPEGGLIIDQAGTLYGTTTNAGSAGGGTVFQLMPSAGSWTYRVLYGLANGPQGGSENGPEAKLFMDAAGNLYGTTVKDGVYGYGSVFKLTPSDGSWTYTSLHDFCADYPTCSDGAYPYSNVVSDKNGNLYGTAAYGGAYGVGVVFEITP